MIKRQKKLSQVLEDYLEAIYILTIIKKQPVARVTDIAEFLKVNKSNVSNNMKLLAKQEYINYDIYHWITLTKKGEKTAKSVYAKHNALINFFNKVLGINKNVSEENACRIEHFADDILIKRMCKLSTFLEKNKVLKFDKKTKNFKFLSELNQEN